MSDEQPDAAGRDRHPFPPSPQYGAAPQYGAPGHGYPAPIPQQSNGMATAGLVCGIVAVVLFWLPVIGWVLGVLGIVFGGIGIARATTGARRKGMAIAGLVLGIVSLALYVLVAAAYVGNV